MITEGMTHQSFMDIYSPLKLVQFNEELSIKNCASSQLWGDWLTGPGRVSWSYHWRILIALHVRALEQQWNGASWSIMEYHGASWSIMEHHGASWSIVDQENQHFQRIFLVRQHWNQAYCIVVHGLGRKNRCLSKKFTFETSLDDPNKCHGLSLCNIGARCSCYAFDFIWWDMTWTMKPVRCCDAYALQHKLTVLF